nr:MAG TPA: hypothetical protein [Caudoviricetes sp.]
MRLEVQGDFMPEVRRICVRGEASATPLLASRPGGSPWLRRCAPSCTVRTGRKRRSSFS